MLIYKKKNLGIEKVFHTRALGKNQLKGSDARCIAIELSKYIEALLIANLISNAILEMINNLVEIF